LVLQTILENLTVREALAMAAALARQGLHGRAAELLRAALAVVPARTDLRVRLGLSANPTSRTGALIDVVDALEPFRDTAYVADGLATWMKILPFFEDPRFMVLSDLHQTLLPIPNWHWNLQTVLWAARQVATTPGDFVELGVFRGHTTLFVADYLEFADMPRTWRLYDTFEGIPEDQLDPEWAAKNKKAYEGTFSFEEVRDRFAGFPNIRVIQGRVPEVLHEDLPEQVAFLHMDLNNSAAEIAALDLLFDRIPSGGVIVFDDYCWEVSRAQHDAEKAWFAARGLHVLPLPTGQGVFVKP
jgi:O-methyltransferase